MAKCKKLSALKRRLVILRLTLLPQGKRAQYLKKQNIFYHFGDNVKWGSSTIPAEPYLVSIGNNVRVAANVTFVTHDIISGLFDADLNLDGTHKFYMGTIEIRDNVAIGTNATILYNTKIGPNAIVAAGSIVTKDVPESAIVGGNPARVIGDYYNLEKKRNQFAKPDNHADLDEILKAYWGDEK